MLVEQAIFTSAQGSMATGYRLVASTRGIAPEEAHELSAAGPSHDSLLEHSPWATSLNFQQLTSGRFCVSKTTAAGGEYSGRGGPRIYTQFLVLSPEDLARFANNPFAVVRAASAQGRMQVYEHVPKELEPIRLAGKSAPVDHGLLAEVLGCQGAEKLAALADAALSCEQLVLVSNEHRPQLVAALLNCLPVECRTTFSFSTGLKPSPGRAFRIVCLGTETETRRLARDRRLRVFNVHEPPSNSNRTAWGDYLRQALASGNTHTLASHLAVGRGNLTVPLLQPLADSLSATMAREEARPQPREPAPTFPRLAEGTDDSPAPESAIANPSGKGGERFTGPGEQRWSPTPDTSRDERFCADTLTRRPKFNVHDEESATPMIRASRTETEQVSQQALETLELLDDIVFAAIGGSAEALARLRQLWPATLARLGEDELLESREHYIRRALAAWRQAAQGSDRVEAERGLQAIEVVCTLFGE